MARYLAIDWDQNQLHVIAADVRGVGRAGPPGHAHGGGQDAQPRRTPRSWASSSPSGWRRRASPGAPVLACLGRDRLIVKEIRHPRVPDAEEAAVVRFQTVKELTDAPEDVVIDYMPTSTPPEGEQKAMALVIRKEVLQTYRTLCEAAGLKLAALSPRLVGTAACLSRVIGSAATPAPEPADGAVCVVVLGEKQAELSILQGPDAVPGAGRDERLEPRRRGPPQPRRPRRAVARSTPSARSTSRARARPRCATGSPTWSRCRSTRSTRSPGPRRPDLPAADRGTFAGAMGLLQARAAGGLPINFVSPRQPKAVAQPELPPRSAWRWWRA